MSASVWAVFEQEKWEQARYLCWHADEAQARKCAALRAGKLGLRFEASGKHWTTPVESRLGRPTITVDVEEIKRCSVSPSAPEQIAVEATKQNVCEHGDHPAPRLHGAARASVPPREASRARAERVPEPWWRRRRDRRARARRAPVAREGEVQVKEQRTLFATREATPRARPPREPRPRSRRIVVRSDLALSLSCLGEHGLFSEVAVAFLRGKL